MSPSLTQKLSPIDNHVQMKSQFPPRESQWQNKLVFRVGCVSSSRWPIGKELGSVFGASLSHNVTSESSLCMILSYFKLSLNIYTHIFLLSFSHTFAYMSWLPIQVFSPPWDSWVCKTSWFLFLTPCLCSFLLFVSFVQFWCVSFCYIISLLPLRSLFDS